jgi:hypothetical protein
MFRFEREQQMLDMCGFRIGGQPGRAAHRVNQQYLLRRTSYRVRPRQGHL